MSIRPTRLVLAGALALSLPLVQGCVVGTVAGAATNVAATGVKAGAKVAGTAVGVGASATGAVVRTATGGK